MKTIGLLGGMSWESSIVYERILNEEVRRRLGGTHSADLLIRSYDFAVLLSLVAAGAGVTLVPTLAARRLPPRVRLLQPAEPVTRQIFTVSRRGGDRKPAVRVVLDALSAAAARPGGEPLAA